MAASTSQEKADYLTNLKRELEDYLKLCNKDGFKKVLQGLPLCTVKQAFAVTVNKDTLGHINKIVELITSIEKEAEKMGASVVTEKVSFLRSVLDYMNNLHLLVLHCQQSLDTNTLIDIDVIEMILDVLGFEIGDTFYEVENWANSRVAQKRYARLSSQFLLDCLLELKVCVNRQKLLIQGGFLYKAIADEDFAAVVANFTPQLAALPSRQLPSPIFCALETGNILILEYIAERSEITTQMDANYSSYSVLHYAARSKKAEIIETLFAYIPKKNVPAIINLKNSRKQTPLHVAAGSGNYNVVQQLCKNGACYNLLDENRETPAVVSRNNDKLVAFFEMLEKIFLLSEQGNAKEVDRILRESVHDVRALLHAQNGTGMSPKMILLEKMQKRL